MGYTGSLEREQGKQVRRAGGNCIVKFSLSFKQLFTTMYTRCPLGIPIKLPPPHPAPFTPPTPHRAMLNSLFFMCFLWQLQPALSTQRNEMCQVMRRTKQDNPSLEFHKPSKWKCSSPKRTERNGAEATPEIDERNIELPPQWGSARCLTTHWSTDQTLYRAYLREEGLFWWITDWSTDRSLYRFIERN